jgi:hypothetical protein
MIPKTMRALRDLGFQPLALYGLYQFGVRTGLFRRITPSYEWKDRPLTEWLIPESRSDPEGFIARAGQARTWFGSPTDDIKAFPQNYPGVVETVLGEADEILDGRHRLFGGGSIELGFPPRWDKYAPLAGGGNLPPVAPHLHWSQYRLDALPGDVKLLWEPSRFGWIYPLSRAFALTDDARYFHGFWDLLRAWLECNPPNTGPHWISGQEAAFRIVAMLFAWQVFRRRFMQDIPRSVQLVQALAVHAARIPPTLIYARAQENNHLLVEAVALYAVGGMFPELASAQAWKELGRKWVVKALDGQVFPDGGYVQHSTNYQRLALEAGLLGVRLAEVYDTPLPPSSIESLARMTRLLSAMTDPVHGRVPNFGPNDGARLLPLSIQPFEDYRPSIQAGAMLCGGDRAFPPGPWDEEAIWLGVGSALVTSPGPQEARITDGEAPGRGGFIRSAGFRQGSLPPGTSGKVGIAYHVVGFGNAGLYFMTGPQSTGMLRAADFNSRPGHSDQLHFDLSWKGTPILQDPGTYLYSGSPPWNNSLAYSRHHNTVLIDEQEPMRKAGKFLWTDWSKASLLGMWSSPGGSIGLMAACHHGYQALGIEHTRSVIRVLDDHWVVVDDVLGEGKHAVRISWLLGDYPAGLMDGRLTFAVQGEAGWITVEGPGLECGLYEAGEWVSGEIVEQDPSAQGWYSPTYAFLRPAFQLIARSQVILPARFITTVNLAGARHDEIHFQWRSPAKGQSACQNVRYRDEVLET